jgi:hypothetical protein
MLLGLGSLVVFGERYTPAWVQPVPSR